jgi:hypothetical protein
MPILQAWLFCISLWRFLPAIVMTTTTIVSVVRGNYRYYQSLFSFLGSLLIPFLNAATSSGNFSSH